MTTKQMDNLTMRNMKKTKGAAMYYYDRLTGDVMLIYENGETEVKKSMAPRVPNIKVDKALWARFPDKGIYEVR